MRPALCGILVVTREEEAMFVRSTDPCLGSVRTFSPRVFVFKLLHAVTCLQLSCFVTYCSDAVLYRLGCLIFG